jgi:chorismate dehydratase
MSGNLRIGRISYLNLYPIFHSLERAGNGHEFVEGYPSMLNAMLRKGEIDVSPSSSIEYLRSPDRYELIDGHSISSDGEIRSILLISRCRIEDLDGKRIASTHQSGTSKVLLEIVIRKFYGLEAKIEETRLPLREAVAPAAKFDAFMAIGDEALLAGGAGKSDNKEGCRIRAIGERDCHVYDLGLIWKKNTGLPFVFALWIANRKAISNKREAFALFVKNLDEAKEYAAGHFEKIARECPFRGLGSDEIADYWEIITYGFGNEEKKGLELFGHYAREMGLI